MEVIKAKYIKNYLIEVTFSNKKVKTIDFKAFLFSALNPMTNQFRDLKLFRKFAVEGGEMTWKNNEMTYSTETLYNWDKIPIL